MLNLVKRNGGYVANEKGDNVEHLHQPWKLISNFKNESENYVDFYDNRGVKFASIYCEQKEDSKIRANLFQTAPELLDLVKNFKEYLNGFIGCDQLNQVLYEKVEEVIANVEGKN